ncbi:hypothetical protein [Brevundimonas aurifodinae]|uniref:Major facilitator superfamily (MFS) profile domain-containing protein n=2 Tax=Brevundimonas TaxID=41275 RepID=A0ABV1NKW6_9CAUL|nr:MAG: hypothetical protein B7Z01_05610 [Brevundimonas subvibrioides]
MSLTESPRPARSRLLLVVLVIETVAAVLAVLPALGMAVMSPMAVAQGNILWVSAFVIVAVTFPLVIVGGPVLGWMAWGERRDRRAWTAVAAPFAWLGLFAALFAASGMSI